jgi:hypothetical protein
MRFYCLLLLIVGAFVGCGQVTSPQRSTRVQTVDRSASMPEKPAANTAGTITSRNAPDANAIRRKIVYRATVDLVVEEFEPVSARIEGLVKQYDAYVARSNVGGTPGMPRTGEWTIRVPADHYDVLLAALRQLGEVRRIRSDSQDVTEEFYDVEARIRNKKQEEARLLKLLETAAGKLEEVLAVEREISRVRGEIEQSEGRLRVLGDLSTLATVELVVAEIKDYAPEETATYSMRVRRSFQASLRALLITGEQVSIALVAISPWLAILLVPGLPLVLWRRARRRR